VSEYDSFANCYDELIKASKDGVTKKYDRLLRVYSPESAGKILLDIGCGTGQLSRHFSRRGFDVIGTDISSEMLNIALEKRGNLPVQYLSQSVTELDLYGTIDIALAARDTLNHLENTDELEKAIRRVAFFMNPGGLFIFDWNTPYKHRETLSGKTFFYETPNVYCVWENSEIGVEDNKIKMSLNLFKREKGGLYRRFQTEINEFSADTVTVKKILKNCGFSVKIYDFDSFKKPTETTEKVVFIAKKTS
jgi:ubiquinone/menaquinone biosynthesis C-methylase UbiE